MHWVLNCFHAWGLCRGGSQVAKWMVEEIISQEPKAERSLMHRFNIALVSHSPAQACTQNPLTSKTLCLYCQGLLFLICRYSTSGYRGILGRKVIRCPALGPA